MDAFIGGYQENFVRKLRYRVQRFDLSVDDVWSMSADLHNHGFTPKGTSPVLCRDRSLMDPAKFYCDVRPYGTYMTVVMVASRSNGTLAMAWSIIKLLDEEGCLEASPDYDAPRYPDVKLRLPRGYPRGWQTRAGLAAFGAYQYDIHAVADAMQAK